MRLWATIAILLFVIVCCVKSELDEPDGNEFYRLSNYQLYPNCESDWIYEIPVLRLLSNPALYNHCKIRVTGYAVVYKTGAAYLGISRTDFVEGNLYGLVPIEFDDRFDSKAFLETSGVVILEGVFDLSVDKVSTLRNGEIKKVTRFDKWGNTNTVLPPER